MKDLFDIKNIYLDLEFKNKIELFKYMSDIFLKKGYVNENYLNALIEREKKYPTGLSFPTFNIAIPHTSPEFINKQNIIIIRLKTPILFRDMGLDENDLEVKMIFMLLINKGEEQVTILMNLMHLLEKGNIYKDMIDASDEEEMYKLIINKI